MSATAASSRVTAAVLVIGDEILSGRTADVNLNAIAKYLTAHGVDLVEARVVADVPADIVDAVNALRTRYDYLITTGGIGPTHDDITADCVAQAFGVELAEDPDIIAEMTARYGASPNPARRRMARIPVGGSKVKNIVAGAPGFQIGNVFVLAGVPAVMRGMLEDLEGRILGGAVAISRTVRVEASPESFLAAPLERTAKAFPDLTMGSYPFSGPAGYGANLVVRGRDPGDLERGVAALIETLAGEGITGVLQEEG
jgi:molybdenum cofactor synthesis domain-containing protein